MISTLDPTLLAEFDQPMGAGSLIRVNTTLTIDIKPLVRSIIDTLDNSTARLGVVAWRYAAIPCGT